MARPIVVIDDRDDNLDVFDMVLTDDGYTVVACHDGAVALACVRDAAPAVVILDVHLDTPDRGWRILEDMQADPALAHIPVIVTTADPKALHQHAAGLHGDGYVMLPKPFDIEELSRLVRQLAGLPHAA
jgi:CheY-like chemotaxis protein